MATQLNAGSDSRVSWNVRLYRSDPLEGVINGSNAAVLIDEVRIPVKYLVNDITLVQMPVDEVRYVELPGNGLLLAEGPAVEIRLDNTQHIA